MEDATQHPMWTEQVRIEQEMSSRGIHRFMREARAAYQDGEASKAGSVRFILSNVIEPTAKAIQAFVDDAKAGKAGRRHTLVRFVTDTPADVLAYLTAKFVLDGIAGEQRLTALSVRLARAVEIEQRLAAVNASQAVLVETVVNDLKSRTRNSEHMRRVMLHTLREHGDGWTEWTKSECVQIGTKLIELLNEATNISRMMAVQANHRTSYVLQLNAGFKTWVAQLDDKLALMSPEHMPCVVPPKDWDAPEGGGYHTDAFIDPLYLVKTRNKDHQDQLRSADLSTVYRAVNAIQRTPWTIEKRTLAVMREIVERRLDLPVLPPQDDLPVPARPASLPAKEEQLTAEQASALDIWKRDAREAYTANEKLASRRLQVAKALALATEFAQYPAIYFPHQLDFRGRCYAVPQVLNPQGSDFAKGLLVFAEGAPLTDDRAKGWFMIHGANTFGNDKVPFDQRIQWVWDHEDEILSCAEDPLANLWWTEADSPFCFLTWCFEMKEWWECEHEGSTFMSRIPVAIDGTCNGLQHYSAMLRDPVGGAAVNLIPSEKPQDIYGEVAKVVIAKLQEAYDVDSPFGEGSKEYYWAMKWLNFGIDRKLTKRPVMVLPYGGTASSCREYVEQAVREKLAGKPSHFGEDHRAACNWLAMIVWESIGEVVVAARAAMGWLMDTARVAAAEGKALKWTSPSGFPVVQAYEELGVSRVKTHLHGGLVFLHLNEEKPGVIDKRRQANGVAPNFVHSLDAAALVLTVDLALDNGVTRFAVIHDSYGTNAPDTDMLAACTREAFVGLYEDNDVLTQFRTAITTELTDKSAAKVKSVPTAGGLDLAVVKDSPFFFA